MRLCAWEGNYGDAQWVRYPSLRSGLNISLLITLSHPYARSSYQFPALRFGEKEKKKPTPPDASSILMHPSVERGLCAAENDSHTHTTSLPPQLPHLTTYLPSHPSAAHVPSPTSTHQIQTQIFLAIFIPPANQSITSLYLTPPLPQKEKKAMQSCTLAAYLLNPFSFFFSTFNTQAKTNKASLALFHFSAASYHLISMVVNFSLVLFFFLGKSG